MLKTSTFKKLAAFIASFTFAGMLIAGMIEGRFTIIWAATKML